MKTFKLLIRIGIFAMAALFLSSYTALKGQGITYFYFYRVYLKDKGDKVLSDYKPEDLISEKAIDRRKRAGIAVPDISDLPVYSNYIEQISQLGFKLHCTSKWLNTALYKTPSLVDINVLRGLPFVADVKIVKSAGSKGIYNDKLDFKVNQAVIPPFDRPGSMVNGKSMHNSGFNGANVLIAVLDGGFLNADQISSLNDLRNRSGIKSTYDFVKGNEMVYNASTHGTAVLSVLAGNLAGLIEGTAPGAEYVLLKTEDVESEFPCEEDFWAAGAEYADSIGADIISSSLGYYNFDDPFMNYKITDLDGKTAFVTQAADIASSKGILVFNSAGNERTKAWKYIIFPSDGFNVISVGAVDGNGYISTFSSSGPSADGRIKPDNVTMGVSVPVQVNAASVGRSDGTSFACPVLSGMAACLLQAVPQSKNIDIINALRTSADRYTDPDSLYGSGIPDMTETLINLQKKYVRIPDESTVIGPNPTAGDFEIIFKEPPVNLTIEVITLAGKIIFRKEFEEYAGRTIIISELQNKEQGLYFVRLIKDTGTDVLKIIKIEK